MSQRTVTLAALLPWLGAAVAFSGTAHVAFAEQTFGPVIATKFDTKVAEVGKRLFFDKRLSGDASLSCSSCHVPKFGFTDGKALSDAYTGALGFRNTPTLLNVALRKYWFHDGRMGTSLNDVTREMITETYMMNMDMRLMQERLKQDPVYVKMFKAAGLGEPSNGGARKAIAEFMKTLTTRGAPFDTNRMSRSAQRGFTLFKGKAGCGACHSGPRFTDDKPHNTGVPENPQVWKDPLRHVTFITFAKFQGVENYMNVRRDVGAYVRTLRKADIGKFVTPTLRGLKYTAPYMHNGTFKTLNQVVAFYNAGGGKDPRKDPRLKPLKLTKRQQQDLVAFLQSLSGQPLTDKKWVWTAEIDEDYSAIPNWLKARN